MKAYESAQKRLQATSQHMKAPPVGPEVGFKAAHQTVDSSARTTGFRDNEFVDSKSETWYPVHDPATNKIVTSVPQMTDEELEDAVQSAQRAFPVWRATSIMARQQIMFRYVNLIRQNWDRLAATITLEQGKTFADAKGDVLRGLQVAETACGITSQLTGEILEVAKDMETKTCREPLGIVAAICPFSGSHYFPYSICFL